jgi:sterol desaturase/sphingolipid hydroxylase (fatty acid hydroxylase superfamily)
VATWTLTEYVLHRFVFHFHPTSEFGKKIHFIFHGIHHDYPCDRLRLVMPPSVSIPLATVFFFFFKLFFTGPSLFPFFAGFLAGYLVYDMFHYMIHHVQVKGKLWNALKTHHLKHHYVNDEKGFGVSSKLWDLIVRTDFTEAKK